MRRHLAKVLLERCVAALLNRPDLTAQQCVGFIVTFIRGCQWAATGKTAQTIPSDFPTADKTSQRKFEEAR